jgi:hypothetical protein
LHKNQVEHDEPSTFDNLPLEQLNNPDFNSVEFDGFRKQAGLNSFTMTPKQWIGRTGAIGIISKQGRYGGTFGRAAGRSLII